MNSESPGSRRARKGHGSLEGGRIKMRLRWLHYKIISREKSHSVISLIGKRKKQKQNNNKNSQLYIHLSRKKSNPPTKYRIGEDSMYGLFEVILIDPFHKAIRPNPETPWIPKPDQKHRERRGLTSAAAKAMALERATGSTILFIGGSHCPSWRMHNTLQLHPYR